MCVLHCNANMLMSEASFRDEDTIDQRCREVRTLAAVSDTPWYTILRLARAVQDQFYIGYHGNQYRKRMPPNHNKVTNTLTMSSSCMCSPYAYMCVHIQAISSQQLCVNNGPPKSDKCRSWKYFNNYNYTYIQYMHFPSIYQHTDT